MTRNFITAFTLVLLFCTSQAFSQAFSVPLEGFSRSKTAYLHMEGGKKFEGQLSGFKRSKGLIETVKMKNPNGKKLKIDPAKISHMYLPPSDLAKFGAAMEKIGNMRNWESDTNIDTTLMGEGYVYFEKVLTIVKKKKDNLMLQLMNAPFSSKILVYHDPFARETMGIGVAGVTVAGGLDKSYYVMKVGKDKAAYRLKKKDYKEQFSKLFGDCPEFMKKYKDDIKWSDLAQHVYEYSQMCN